MVMTMMMPGPIGMVHGMGRGGGMVDLVAGALLVEAMVVMEAIAGQDTTGRVVLVLDMVGVTGLVVVAVVVEVVAEVVEVVEVVVAVEVVTGKNIFNC